MSTSLCDNLLLKEDKVSNENPFLSSKGLSEKFKSYMNLFNITNDW